MSDPAPPMTYAPAQLRIHQFAALLPGPRLIVTGAVHGSERCGTRGIERVLSELDSGELTIARGQLTLVPVTNPLAYSKGERNGERNLNRNLQPRAQPQDNEDRIANVLCPLLARHDVLLDLHSFSSLGEAFSLIGPANNSGALEPVAHAAHEQALALRLGPRRIVEGWLSTYAAGVQLRLARTQPSERATLLNTALSHGVGTTEYMRKTGGYAITLECGQHDDPQASRVAYRAIRNALAHLGLVDAAPPPACTDVEFLRLSEVFDRHHSDDRFSQAWASYDVVAAGAPIAVRHDGTSVLAPRDGYIVFPDANAQPGNEWFYFAHRSSRDIVGTTA
ncbi:succinylglutamate desuccinylase/aspartoacylase family protein [Rhodoferax sp.]|uniref:succinylglutamate desuccinylase/aspartoacylase domain-containing protein n=1 Tax=Rhodoferax sp. TaxID=50421 RepID=UPI0039B91FDB